jgi:hypothetical protein
VTPEIARIEACPFPRLKLVIAELNALRPLGIQHIDMPLTPERVCRAIQSAKRQAAQ